MEVQPINLKQKFFQRWQNIKRGGILGLTFIIVRSLYLNINCLLTSLYIKLKSELGGSGILNILSGQPNRKQYRVLAQSEDNLLDLTNPKSNVYMILLIAGLSILLLGGLIFCVIFIVKFILRRNQVADFNHSPQKEERHQQINVQTLFPSLPYIVFEKQIGKPLQDNCVICLQSYEKNISLKSNKAFDSALYVCLTVCGHVLHGKCLKQWLKRQLNCPLCREQFKQDNIQKWEKKLKFEFKYVYCLIHQKTMAIRHKIRNQRIKNSMGRERVDTEDLKMNKGREKRIINQERYKKYNIDTVVERICDKMKNKKVRLSVIVNENQGENNYIRQGLQFKFKRSEEGLESTQCFMYQLAEAQFYALVIYSEIMEYHQAFHDNNQTIY